MMPNIHSRLVLSLFKGLDSTTALTVIEALKEIAVNRGSTLILTIHQPSAKLYGMFDKCLFLSGVVLYIVHCRLCWEGISRNQLICMPKVYSMFCKWCRWESHVFRSGRWIARIRNKDLLRSKLGHPPYCKRTRSVLRVVRCVNRWWSLRSGYYWHCAEAFQWQSARCTVNKRWMHHC